MTLLKRIGILLGLVLVVLISVPYLALIIIDQSDERSWITRVIGDATDREIVLDTAEVKWGLQPEIRIEGVRIERASKPGFRADHIALKLSLHKLITAGLSVFSLEVAGARIILAQAAEGGSTDSVPLESATLGIGSVLWLLDSILVFDSVVVGGSSGSAWNLVLHEAELDSRFDGSSGLHIRATFHETLMELSGRTGGMSEIVSGQTIPLELVGYAGNSSNRMTISGRIHDVLNGRGLDLRVRADIASFDDLPPLAGLQFPGFSGLSGEVHVVRKRAFESMQFKKVDIQSSVLGLGLRVQGQVGQVRNWQDIALEVALYGSVTDPGILELRSVGGQMEVDIRGSISGAAAEMDLVLSHGAVLTREVIADISGTIGNPLGDWESPATLSLRMRPESSMIPEFVQVLPPLSAEADLYWKSGQLEARNLWIRGGSSETNDIWLLGEGMLHRIGHGISGTISLSSSLDGIALSKLSGSDQLPDASLITRAEWSVENGVSHVKDIQIDGSAPGLALRGTGTYPEPAHPETLQMRLEVNGDSIGRLESFMDMDFPQTGRFSGSANLTGSKEGVYRLENLVFSVEGETLSAEIVGEAALSGPGLPLDLTFRSEIADPALLAGYLGDPGVLDEVGFLFPLLAQGAISASAGKSGERQYSLDRLEVNSLSATHDLAVTGFIKALNTPQQRGAVELSLSGSLDTGQDERFEQWSGQLPFLTGNLEARTRVEIYPENIQVGDLDLSVRGNHFSISARGALESMDPFHVKDMKVRFSADTLSHLYNFSDSDSDMNTDIPVKGELVIHEEKGKQMLDLSLSIADDDLTASMHFVPAGLDSPRPMISGWISAHSLDLTQILEPPEKSNQVFSRTPFGLEWVDRADIDLELDINSFRNRVLNLKHLDGRIRTMDGSMEVIVSGSSHTRPLDLHMRLDRQKDRWISRIKLQGEGVDMGILPNLLGQQQAEMGTFSVDLDLSGSGNSVSEIAATADGKIYLDLDGARVRGGVLRLLSADFLLGVLDSARIWTANSEWINTECGAFLLNVKDGVASTDQGLAIKFEDFTLIGGGQIDLSNEQLDIVFSSKARKGLGINTNTLAKMVRVGGTIKNPEIGTDSRGLFKTGLALGAALASGGLSLIAQGLLDKQIANSDVCQFVRGQRVEVREYQVGAG